MPTGTQYLLLRGIIDPVWNHICWVNFEVTYGVVLPKIWRDVGDWFTGRMAPNTWRGALAKTTPTPMAGVDEANVSTCRGDFPVLV